MSRINYVMIRWTDGYQTQYPNLELAKTAILADNLHDVESIQDEDGNEYSCTLGVILEKKVKPSAGTVECWQCKTVFVPAVNPVLEDTNGHKFCGSDCYHNSRKS